MKRNPRPPDYAVTARARSCVGCGTTFTPYPSAIRRSAAKWCSWSCYSAHRPDPFVELTCAAPECNRTFRRNRTQVARRQRSFCSVECMGRGMVRDPLPGGRLTSYRGYGWARVAEAIRERDGYRCRRCGKTQEEEGKSLPVDHVIPFRSFSSVAEANDPENLVALCSVCHGRKFKAERKWHQGDVLEMQQFRASVAEPWTANGVSSSVAEPPPVREHTHVDPVYGCRQCSEAWA